MGNIKEDLRQKILEQLSWETKEEMHDLDVDLMNGRLILRGTAPSYESLRAIEETVYAVDGIDGVDNSMMIRYPDDITAVTDDDIRAYIENGLSDNKSLNAAAIGVTVNEGVVILQGGVDAYWKKRLAEDIASYATGVIEIKNEIHVESKEEVMDDIIRRDIETALKENLNVRAEWINVDVDHGVATLTGAVPDFNAARAAYTAALYVNGVSGVHNDLKVKTL